MKSIKENFGLHTAGSGTKIQKLGWGVGGGVGGATFWTKKSRILDQKEGKICNQKA